MNLLVRPQISKIVEEYRSFGPGEKGLAYVELRNDDPGAAFVANVWLHFDWQGDLSYPIKLGNLIMSGSKKTVGPIYFEIPNSIVGARKYKVGIETLDQQYSAAWVSHELLWTGDFDFQVEPYPTYTAFVSCSNRDEDRDIVNFIKSRIRIWGFDTITVGQEVKASRDLAQTIQDQATKADCLIAIATPRILDAITNAWETLPWVHGETGITYGKEKPILILRDQSVKLSGLLGQIPWQAEYDANSREELSVKLDLIMPSFRAWIASKKSSEFLNTLLKLGAAAFGLVLAYKAGRESAIL